MKRLALVAVVGLLGCQMAGFGPDRSLDVTDPTAVVDRLTLLETLSSKLSVGTTRILVGDAVSFAIVPETASGVTISNVQLVWTSTPAGAFAGTRTQMTYADTSFVATSIGTATIRVQTADGVRTTTGAPVSWEATFEIRPR